MGVRVKYVMFSTNEIYEHIADTIGQVKRKVPLRKDQGFKIDPFKWDGYTVESTGITLRREIRKDGNRVHLCSCGCGYATRNGWNSLKGHGIGRSVHQQGQNNRLSKSF